MNKYGLALTAPISQTIIPVMTKAGLVLGFYPIAKKDFDGSETSGVTSDGVAYPLTTVTVDKNSTFRSVSQYMAAVWEAGLPVKFAPWASNDLIENGEGRYSWYSMPSQGWVTHFSKGIMLEAIQNSMIPVVPVPGFNPADPPVASSASQTWQATAAYHSLMGDCAFFEFNWMTVFAAKNINSNDALRIQVISNPSPINGEAQSPLKATIIGMPIATTNGVVYNTIRVTRLTNLNAGAYVFQFRVIDTADQSIDVTFTLNVL